MILNLMYIYDRGRFTTILLTHNTLERLYTSMLMIVKTILRIG